MNRQAHMGSPSAQIFKRVIARRGAQLGLIWIGLLVVVAVFAPFLASSHPLVITTQEGWRSPLFHHLGGMDITLVVIFFFSLFTLLYRKRSRRILMTGFAFVGLISIVAFIQFDPPELVVYEQYREGAAQQTLEVGLTAPIPFSPKDYLRDWGDTGLQAPLHRTSAMHLMGTEENGADVLSRMIHASRIALGIGFVATGIAMVLGVLIGGAMGYFSGIVDIIGMRLVEIFEAVPTLFLLLTFVAFFERSLYLMMVIIGLTSWPGYARYVRAEFLRLRELEFVQAAIVSGLPLRSILFRHMLPNGVAPVLVAASFGVA